MKPRRFVALYRWDERLSPDALMRMVLALKEILQLQPNRGFLSRLNGSRQKRPRISRRTDWVEVSSYFEEFDSFSLSEFDKMWPGNCRGTMTLRFVAGRTMLSFAHDHQILTTEVARRAIFCALEHISPQVGFGDVDVGVNPALFPSGITTFDNDERSDRALRLKKGLKENQYQDGRLLDVLEFNLITSTLANRRVDGEKFVAWAEQQPGCSVHFYRDDCVLWRVNAECRPALRRKLLKEGVLFV